MSNNWCRFTLWQVEGWQIVYCQNSQDTASFTQNSVTFSSCVVRGFKIVLSLTLAHVQIHHPGIQVHLSRTDSTDQRWQLLEDVRDGQGLTVQCPPPHRHHESDWVNQAALVESQELLHGMVNLDVCDLHVRKWQCKFLQMVLQY